MRRGVSRRPAVLPRPTSPGRFLVRHASAPTSATPWLVIRWISSVQAALAEGRWTRNFARMSALARFKDMGDVPEVGATAAVGVMSDPGDERSGSNSGQRLRLLDG